MKKSSIEISGGYLFHKVFDMNYDSNSIIESMHFLSIYNNISTECDNISEICKKKKKKMTLDNETGIVGVMWTRHLIE